MAKTPFILRQTIIDAAGAAFFRQQVFTILGGDTVDRVIIHVEHWMLNNVDVDGLGNSTIHSIDYTQGPDINPPPTPPQPSGTPSIPGRLWWGYLQAREQRYNESLGTSVIQTRIDTPPDGIETKGKRLTQQGNFGGLWYQYAQIGHGIGIPFNTWATRVSMMAVVLTPPAGLTAAARAFYEGQAAETGGSVQFSEASLSAATSGSAPLREETPPTG